jgi:DNA-binding MarR family transcriptional regulator
MVDEALKQHVIAYLASDESRARGYQALAMITEQMTLPEDWWEARLGGLEEYDLEQRVAAILDELADQGFVEVHQAPKDQKRSFWLRREYEVREQAGKTQVKALVDTQPPRGNRALDDDDQWLLRMLASERRHSGDQVITVPDAFHRFGIPVPSQWIHDALRRLEIARYIDMLPALAEQFRQPLVTISAEGLRVADELNREHGVNDAFDLLLPQQEVREGSDGGAKPKHGAEQLESLVRLDHSDDDYQAIRNGLDALYERVRQDNEVGSTADERARILSSLSAAKQLWASTELQLVQVKVGVIMAVEDAYRALVAIGKEVGKLVLADMIKEYIKSKTGWLP